MYRHFLLLISIFIPLLCSVNATVYYVTTDDHMVDKNTHSLHHYIMNRSAYFDSYNQLHFLSGEHFLRSDFIIKNVKNFTISGNNSIITCKNMSVGISFIGVANLVMRGIKIVQCGRYYMVSLNTSTDDIQPILNSTVIYMSHCSIKISNISISGRTGMNAIVIVNIYAITLRGSALLTMKNVRVYTDCHNSSLPVNGILFYYSDYTNPKKSHNILISHYTYNAIGVCYSSSAFKHIMTQETYTVLIKISKSHFTSLQNSSVLHYFGKSCGGDFNTIVRFYDCSIIYNNGTSNVNLFHIVVHSEGDLFGSVKGRKHCNEQTNIISLDHCFIGNNSNLHSLIHAIVKNTLAFNLYIEIKHSKFSFNHGVQFISIQSELKSLWQSSHYITMTETVISSNTHSYKASLISSTNGLIKFSQNIIFTNNTCGNIIQLRLSVLKFKGYSEFTFNQARHVLKSKEGSYYLLKGMSITTVNISYNFVYSVLDVDPAYDDDNLKEVCYFQFIKNRNEKVNNETLNYKIFMIDNTQTAPEQYIINVSSMNCTWLKGTLFSTMESSKVLSSLIKTRRISANKHNIGTINSSICWCANSYSVNCNVHRLGSIFPGQTLKVKLAVNLLEAKRDDSVVMIAKTKELPPHGCIISYVAEIAQEYSNDGCNQYNYTIWSDKPECELYLSADDRPEIFYVEMKACPVGFSLQQDRKACYCDPTLSTEHITILSCNLDDGTILRPANSWISADSDNNSYTYYVSSQCPFDYCLPYSSHHNLSNPDTQCQFHRSGELCGKCQQGLSTVFGSSRCKQCTNYYLLIIIPIAIMGFVLVLLIFIFNFTVTDGTINIFILYANIISMNFSLFCTNRYYIDCCTILSLMNLDLGFELCFYNGMDNYAKMWIQLAFPFYLISIAIALIIGSRYFVIVQRLTAHRALHLLATLILLSYTKVLLAVCQVLFFFSPIIHLPSKQTEIVWSIDANVSIATTKLLVLYVICAILFVIILLFNILLLFPRKLSRFKLVNTFKPLLDAFLGPYKDRFSFWTGLQLLLRAVFFSTSAFNREISLTCGTVITAAALCLQGVTHPYKSKFKNIQELLIMFNLLVVCSVSTLTHNNNQATFYIMKVLINIVPLYFVIFIACRCIMTTCGDAVTQKCRLMIEKRKCQIASVHIATKLTTEIPDLTYNYKEFQEPLIELEN